MSKRIKIAVWIVIGCVVLAGLCVGYGVMVVVQRFADEDMIAHTYLPIANAIVQYEDAHDGPPATLDDLLPQHLDALPQSDLVERIEYRVWEDDKHWTLTLHTHDHGVWHWWLEPDEAVMEQVNWSVHGWQIVRDEP